MNKQELIDKAVEQLKGKWCGTESQDYLLYRPEAQGTAYYPFYVTHDESMLGMYHGMNRQEFTQRARELGWVNGYKYGVEYGTDSKKPDLPDDVEIFFKSDRNQQGLCMTKDVYWHSVKSFRILDQRFKPVESATSNEVEQVQADWYNYDKRQAIAGEFPKHLEKVVVNHKSELVFAVVGQSLTGYVVVQNCDTGEFHAFHLNQIKPLDWNRKADKERRLLIEVITSAGNLSEGMLADAILAAGFTKNKAESVTRFEYNSERPDEQHVARFALMPDQYAELIIRNKAAS